MKNQISSTNQSYKIAHLSSSHPVEDVRIFKKECRSLVNQGFSVVLLIPGSDKKLLQGVAIKSFSKSQNRFIRTFITSFKIIKMAMKERADLYHLHAEPDILLWGQLLRFTGKPIIYDMHENMPKSFLTKTWIAKPLRMIIAKLYRIIERILLIGIPIVFAEASYQKDYPFAHKKSCVCQNMPIIDHLHTISNPKYKQVTLGYIGGVSDARGAGITLEILHRLNQRNYSTYFECIGPAEPAYQKELEKMMLMYSLGSQVHLRGYAPPEQGWDIISRCHIGLAILKPIPNYFESYPTKLFEYMAMGIPVITSNFPLYKQVIDETECGFTIDPEDIDQIIDRIIWLADHPEQARQMGENGRIATLNKYNWNIELQKLLHLYEELLPNQKH